MRTDKSVCPLKACCENIDGKWKGGIIVELLKGTRRFGELKRELAGITQRVLTKELRELEQARIVRRRVYAEVPPRVEYSLTEIGTTLGPVIQAKRAWGRRYLEFISSEDSKPAKKLVPNKLNLR